jgi:AraC-like DNA-binding protein
VPRRSPILHDATFRRLCRARDLAHSNFSEPIDTAVLAREAALSIWHFHRLFTSVFAATPHDFLTQIRIGRAKELLASGTYSVTDACVAVGYTSVGSFSTKFRALVGRPPSEYRRELWQVFGVTAPSRFAFIPTCFLSEIGGCG